MQAHHITPRGEGGADDIENLITLCNSCHDIVEVAGYRIRADIIAYEGAPVLKKPEKTALKTEEGYSFVRPDWHRWVYGAGRH